MRFHGMVHGIYHVCLHAVRVACSMSISSCSAENMQQLCMYIDICIHIDIWTHTHARTHTHTYTHTHDTHTHTQIDTIGKSVQSASLHCTLVCICASLLKLLIFFLFRSLYTFRRFLFPRRSRIYTYRRKLRNNCSLDKEYNYIKNRLAFIKKLETAL